MVALLVFQMAALDGKGPFGGSSFKNPARITKAPFRAGLPVIKNPPGVKERRVNKVGWRQSNMEVYRLSGEAEKVAERLEQQ